MPCNEDGIINAHYTKLNVRSSIGQKILPNLTSKLRFERFEIYTAYSRQCLCPHKSNWTISFRSRVYFLSCLHINYRNFSVNYNLIHSQCVYNFLQWIDNFHFTEQPFSQCCSQYLWKYCVLQRVSNRLNDTIKIICVSKCVITYWIDPRSRPT